MEGHYQRRPASKFSVPIVHSSCLHLPACRIDFTCSNFKRSLRQAGAEVQAHDVSACPPNLFLKKAGGHAGVSFVVRIFATGGTEEAFPIDYMLVFFYRGRR